MFRIPKFRKANPYDKANLLSKLTFWWLNPFLYKGYKTELNNNDLYQVSSSDSSTKLGNLIQYEWTKESKNDRKSLLLFVLLKIFGIRYLFYGFLGLAEECFLKIVQPIVLGYLIRYFSEKSNFSNQNYDGHIYAGTLILIAFLVICTNHPFSFGVLRIGMQIRIAVTSLIYRKILKLSQSSIKQTNIGQMINFLSNDVNRFDTLAIYLHYIWIGPILTVFVTLVLWSYFGPSCLAGLALIILSIPLQGFIGSLFSKYRSATAEAIDRRIRLINEIINGLRSIKMYAWEATFQNFLQKSRENEVKLLTKIANLRAFNYGLAFTSSKIIFFATIITHLYTNCEGLTAESVFVSMALYNNIRLVMTILFPNAISYMAETSVAIERLEKFLSMDEHEGQIKENDENMASNFKSDGTCIDMKNVNSKWSYGDDVNFLKNLTFSVKPGQLIACIGPIGSGKTSFLHTIMRELKITNGNLNVDGSFVYVSQEPWIFTGSIRENILLGKNYEVEKSLYVKSLKACALDKDIENLPNGDKTLDKGLSGGQKSRINLARAVLSNADIYLLDDPLSAVDSEVGRHLFQKCINGILKGKTRILVTHQVECLKYVDHIIILENGRIKSQGSFNELFIKNPQTLEEFQDFEENTEENDWVGEINLVNKNPNKKFTRKRRDSIYTDSELLEKENLRKKSMIPDPEDLHIVEEEKMCEGSMGFGIFWKYFRMGSNWCHLVLLILVNVVLQGLFTGSDFWLNYWTKEESKSKSNITDTTLFTSQKDLNINDYHFDNIFNIFNYNLYYIKNSAINENNDRDFKVIIYSAFILAILLMSLIRTFLFFQASMRSAIQMHQNLFQGIIHARMQFFDQNPIGRVFSRFSRDTGNIDDYLPAVFYDTMQIFINIGGIICAISIVNPAILGPTAILLFVFYFLRKFYIKTARNLKRLEGINRSPIYSHISTTILGLSTIRSHQVQDQYLEKFDEIQDLHTAAFFLFLSTNRWLGIRLDWISVLFLTIVTFSFMIFSPEGGSEVGLAISSAMMLTGVFQYGVRQSAELENQFVSVERVLEYSNIKPEASLKSDEGPPKNWPNNGEITFKNLELKCGELSNETCILKNISCTFNPSEKVGIVGRTGAGKSSLITALFRIVEPSKGQILIDGQNILEIGLYELRSKISIIPQEPFLFANSIRQNLDPFNSYSDLDIWSVLKDVHLAQDIQLMPAGLDSQVSEGGSNFSVGQRQLICLGRAILRQNKILVLDEATANIDQKTDILIQQTIRNKFANCTVLTIAHRLHTIMDSDRILVLDKGEKIEFDSPYKLLQNKSSALSKLVEQVEKSISQDLLLLAKESERNREENGIFITNL